MEVDPLCIKQEKIPEKLSDFDAILLCPNCNEVFRRQAALVSHRKSCDNCLKFIKEDGSCGICGWNDESKSIFRHLRQEHKHKILTQPKKTKIKNIVKLKVYYITNITILPRKLKYYLHLQIIKQEMKPKKLVKKMKHQKDKNLKKCPMCAKTFKGKNWISSHLELCKKYFKFLHGDKCSLCGKICQTVSGFFNHAKKVHQAQIEYESTGDVLKEAKLKLKMNSKRDDKNPNQCPMCAKVFKNNMWIPTHLKLCKKYFKFLDGDKCLLCGKLCSTLKGFFQHVKKSHESQIENVDQVENLEGNEEKLKLKCIRCNIDFKDQTSFLAHLRVFHGQKSKIEKVLLKKLPIQSDESKEVENNEMVDPEALTKVFACPLCQGKFPIKTSAEMHVLKFHKLTLTTQISMGIKIKEINL